MVTIIEESHLHRVESNGAEAVNTPGEGTDRGAPLFVPDVHLLAACRKYIILLVMVKPGEDCLQGTSNIIHHKTFTDTTYRAGCYSTKKIQ